MVHDCRLLPRFQPSVPGHVAVMRVRLAAARFPRAEFVTPQLQPAQKQAPLERGLLLPQVGEIDNGVSLIWLHPLPRQSSPIK
jgi:hypothetical protein